MENRNERKKFVAREISKGNIETAYKVNKETNKLNMKEEREKGAATLEKVKLLFKTTNASYCI